MTVDNSQFAEEQRTEAFRREVMAELVGCRKAAEGTRGYVGWLLGITIALVLLNTMAMAAAFS